MGLFVYYFGSKKQYKDVAHHTICFGNSYKKQFADFVINNSKDDESWKKQINKLYNFYFY